MTTRPKSDDTPIACTAADLALAADSLLKLLPAGSLTKSKILNVFAANIAGARHDWGYIKGRDAVISQRLAAQPELAAKLCLSETPTADETDAPDIHKVAHGAYPATAHLFFRSMKPILIVRGKPGMGLFHTLSETAEALGGDVLDVRLNAGHPDDLLDHSVGGRRLKPGLRPSVFGETLTIYSEMDRAPDVVLRALLHELVELRDASDRARVALISIEPDGFIERLRHIAPDLVDQAFHIEVQTEPSAQMRLQPTYHRMRDRFHQLRTRKILANTWPIAEVAAIEGRLTVAFADPVTKEVTLRSMPRRALKAAFRLKADERINILSETLRISQHDDDVIEVHTTIEGRPCVQTLERSELLAAINALKPEGLYPGDIDEGSGVAFADFAPGQGLLSIIFRTQNPHTGEIVGPKIVTLARPVTAELMELALKETKRLKDEGLSSESLKIKVGEIEIVPQGGRSFIHSKHWNLMNRVKTEELFDALLKANPHQR